MDESVCRDAEGEMQPAMSAVEEVYRNNALNQVRRIEKYLKHLSDDDKERLDFDIKTYCDSLRAGVAVNQKFLRQFDLDCASALTYSHMRRWVREWSTEVERIEGYEMLVNALTAHVPVGKKVWVPSAALGRLVFEIQKKRYSVIGTETSPINIRGLEVLKTLKKDAIELQPYATETCNQFETGDNLRVIRVPDEDPLAYGELCISSEVPAEKSMGAVVSCFHIDQIESLRAVCEIAQVLEPGGVWLNFGPLDTAEEGNPHMALRLSWDEIQAAASKFFTFPTEATYHPSFYLTNAKSLMHIQYQCLFFRAVRNDVPVP
eukprot:GEMP01049399.1.p1 GENE.GEMP01049399.1~~GEMP01049399.1.p1  ORF type:complete len:319 (+),score=62.29 GEMP01049399.1:92-1048(+)